MEKRVRFSDRDGSPLKSQRQEEASNAERVLRNIEIFSYSISFLISLAIGWKNNTEAHESINILFICLMMPVLFIPMVLTSISQKRAAYLYLSVSLIAIQSLLVCLYEQNAKRNKHINLFALCLITGGATVSSSLTFSKTVIGLYSVIFGQGDTLTKVAICISLVDFIFVVYRFSTAFFHYARKDMSRVELIEGRNNTSRRKKPIFGQVESKEKKNDYLFSLTGRRDEEINKGPEDPSWQDLRIGEEEINLKVLKDQVIENMKMADKCTQTEIGYAKSNSPIMFNSIKQILLNPKMPQSEVNPEITNMKSMLQSQLPEEGIFNSNRNMDTSYNSNLRPAAQTTAKLLIEYFSMVDELILVANSQMKVIASNFSERIMDNVVSKMASRFAIENMVEGKEGNFEMENMFREMKKDMMFCGNETYGNLIKIFEIFNYEETKQKKKEKYKKKKIDRILKYISNLKEENRISDSKEPRLRLKNAANHVMSSLQAADLTRDNLMVGWL